MKRDRWILRLAAVVLVIGSLTLRAADLEEEDDDDDDDEPVAVGTVTTEADAPESRLGGWLELRPSFSVGDQSVHTENETALSWSLTDDSTLGYTQEWTAGVYRSPVAEGDPVVPSGLGDGYLWATFDNLFTASRGNVRLSYEPRLYLPTAAVEREAGLIAATRQMVKLDVRVSGRLELFVYEVPVVAIYGRSGYHDDDGSYANRYFENRVELGARANFWNEKVVATFKAVLQSRRFAAFEEDAENDDRWSHLFHIEPEITLQVASKTRVGAAYYSDALFSDTFGEARLAQGFEHGVFQAVFLQEI